MIQFTLTPIAAAHCTRTGYGYEDMVGWLPQMLSEHDPRPAREQLNSGYVHGGGWSSFDGFSLTYDPDGLPQLTYPDDPDTVAIAQGQLRDEKVILFQHSWVAVVQRDGSFEVARMD